MFRSRFAVVATIIGVFALALEVWSQTQALTIVAALPVGDLAEAADARDIRVVFSEPMVTLGTPVTEPPPWLTIEPATRGVVHWSGTTILIFTPQAPALPNATAFAVTIDALATSVAGHRLAAPYRFTFTTPTVRVLSAEWYRKAGRFDSAAVLALRFNQRVRPREVLQHTQLRLTPHPWGQPILTDAARARMSRVDPDGLRQFDDKVAAVRAVTTSKEPIGARLADHWNEQRFPRADTLVVLETTTPVPPEAWVTVALDGELPSAEGRARHAPQATTVRMERAFFMDTLTCNPSCDPDVWHGLNTWRPLTASRLKAALTLTDLSSAPDGLPVAAASGPDLTLPSQSMTTFLPEQLGFPQQPANQTWAFRVAASLRADDGQVLGYPWTAVIVNGHAQALLSLSGSLWDADKSPSAPFVARNLAGVDVWMQPVSVEDLVPVWQTLVTPRRLFQTPPPLIPLTLDLSPVMDTIESHGLPMTTVLSSAGTGLVWTAVRGASTVPEVARRTNDGLSTPRAALVQVTHLAITVKDGSDSTLVYVSRLDTGAAVPGALVSIRRLDNTVAWRGTTGDDGVAMAPALALRSAERPWILSFLVTAEKNDDVAFVASDWLDYSGGGAQRTGDGAVLRGSVFTDRGVYRLGDDVNVKAILRQGRGEGVALFSAKTAFDVLIVDQQNREIDRRTIAVNGWSAADWTWHIPADAPLGGYRIVVAGQNLPKNSPTNAFHTASGSFQVAAYRPPEFRVDARVVSAAPVLGAKLHATADARYLFGATLGPQPVRWRAWRWPAWGAPEAVQKRYPENQFAFGYSLQERQPADVGGRQTTLDAAGHLSVELPTKSDTDASFSYSFESDVEGLSLQHIAGRASIVLYPADIIIGVKRPAGFVSTSSGVTLDVVAVTLGGRPVSSVPIQLSLARQEWEYRTAQGGYLQWQRKEIAAGEWTTTSGTSATSVPVTVPSGGSYVLHATARDSRGRRTRTDLEFFATGPGVTRWRSDGNRLPLTLEKTDLSVGDTARILIQSPWEQATALVTVEREGVRAYRRVDVTSTQDVIEVPLSSADVPNVFVSVMLVKGLSWRMGTLNLAVEDPDKRLDVRVDSDRQEYKPHDRADVSVTVKDPRGQPVAGEVTLWAVDYGHLSLTGYETPDVSGDIYAHRPLQVFTQDNRLRSIAQPETGSVNHVQRSTTIMGLPPRALAVTLDGVNVSEQYLMDPSGSSFFMRAQTDLIENVTPGADSSSGGALQMRTDFRAVAFWLGSIETGADGRARTSVTLPDSLTTYRIMAVAGDAASRFGSAGHEISAAKPLTLLPAVPRFLTKGDEASFGATVTNNSHVAGDAVIEIASLDSAALTFGAVTRRTLHLAAGVSAPVRFDATARDPGAARVRMTVAMGQDTDAFEVTLPVTIPTRLTTVAAYGDTTSSASERIALPPGARLDTGGLRIDLSSSALVGLGESARYLDEYPYECGEQKASRALALLLAADLDAAFSLGRNAAATRASAVDAVHQLSGYQCQDGGFTLWPGLCGTTSPYLTAYILHVIQAAGRLKLPVDAYALQRGLDYLTRQPRAVPTDVRQVPAWATSQAFAAKVLAEGGRQTAEDRRRLSAVAERLPVVALSYLADAFAAAKDGGPSYQDVVRRLMNAIHADGGRAHVEEVDDDALAWLWNTNARSTAVVLDGLSRRGETGPFGPSLVRWLLEARTNGRWGATHDNAAALEALVAYYRAFESETPQMTTAVRLGGLVVGTPAFAGQSTTAQQVRVTMADLAQQLASGSASDLTIAREGTGRLYYTARLQYLAPISPEPIERGIRIERRYERAATNGGASTAAATTDFHAGDLIRVTLSVTLASEGRYLAMTDRLPAGFEAVDATLKTTATDIARTATVTSSNRNWMAWWREGGFDHVEKHDDRVLAFATRLGPGSHDFSYLVRATSAGVFNAAGAWIEQMYVPDVMGQSAASIVRIR
jgi:uncharacterized protein YfaS (alpha-2-macroglobulin family)